MVVSIYMNIQRISQKGKREEGGGTLKAPARKPLRASVVTSSGGSLVPLEEVNRIVGFGGVSGGVDAEETWMFAAK